MKRQVLAYIEAGATLLMAGAAVTVAVAYLSGLSGRGGQPTVRVPAEEWPAVVESGARVGPANAAAVVVEFVDFQCPFCGAANAMLDSLLSEYPASVALVMHHFPLRSHEYAIPAAVAAECAREQSRLREMASALFNDLGSLGVKSWRDYATAAGIPDEVAFVRCTERPTESFENIARGSRACEEV
jgi:protein-disulfide isomerase